MCIANKEKTYSVGLHSFSISIDSTKFLWTYLSNYESFFIKQSGLSKHTVKDNVFTLTVSDIIINNSEFYPIFSSNKNENDVFKYEIYKNKKSNYLFEIKNSESDRICAIILFRSHFKYTVLNLFGNDSENIFSLNRAIMLSYILATAEKDTLLMHASVIMNEGMGYLFMGKSGTGKSTHTGLWLNHINGSELMNDDNPVVRIIDGMPIVFGSPWSGKTNCYRNVSAPIGGFIRLKQAPFNKIRRQNIIESYASLTTSGSGMSWEKHTADGKDKSIRGFIDKVPCWLLECLPNEDAARLCEATVKKGE